MSAGGEENGEVFCAELVSSGRVTIPKIVRKKLKLSEGTEVRVRIWLDDKEQQLPSVATKDRFQRR